MNNVHRYTTYGKIREIRNRHFSLTNEGISFVDCINQIVETKEFFCGAPNKPNFLSWNLKNYSYFVDLVNQIPISIDEVMSFDHYTHNGITQLSSNNHIQINLELPYNSKELIAINNFSLVYVLSGNCTLFYNSTEQQLKKGELCILPPNIPYYVHVLPSDLVVTIVSDSRHFADNFSFLLSQNNPVSSFFRDTLFCSKSEVLKLMLPVTNDILNLIQHLFAEFVTKDAFSETFFNNYLQIFYASIIRNLDSLNLYTNSSNHFTITEVMPAILGYISTNYQHVTLEDLENAFHYDSAYLSKQIHNATGKPFTKLVGELKIAEAKKMLLDTDFSIEIVAEHCGYHSSDHFTYMFKKYTNISPTTYRKNNKQ